MRVQPALGAQRGNPLRVEDLLRAPELFALRPGIAQSCSDAFNNQ